MLSPQQVANPDLEEWHSQARVSITDRKQVVQLGCSVHKSSLSMIVVKAGQAEMVGLPRFGCRVYSLPSVILELAGSVSAAVIEPLVVDLSLLKADDSLHSGGFFPVTDDFTRQTK